MNNLCTYVYSGPAQSGNVPGYGTNVPEQDLMYYPDSRSHQASRNRPGHPFSDTGFPISSNNPTNVFSTRQPNQHQPISYGSEVSRKKIAIIHVFSPYECFFKTSI